jgi:hypothetical protein
VNDDRGAEAGAADPDFLVDNEKNLFYKYENNSIINN